jgi:hypothetical protein
MPNRRRSAAAVVATLAALATWLVLSPTSSAAPTYSCGNVHLSALRRFGYRSEHLLIVPRTLSCARARRLATSYFTSHAEAHGSGGFRQLGAYYCGGGLSALHSGTALLCLDRSDGSRVILELRVRPLPPAPPLLVSPPAPRPAVHGGSGALTLTGRVGPLRIGMARRSDIESFAGGPDSERYAEGLIELGYDCTFPSGTPDCQTAFFLDAANRLVQFSTASPSYKAFGMVTVGTSTTRAAQLAHAQALVGCLTGIWRHSSRSNIWLTMEIEGASARSVRGKLLAVGGRVGWLFLSQRGLPPC